MKEEKVEEQGGTLKSEISPQFNLIEFIKKPQNWSLILASYLLVVGLLGFPLIVYSGPISIALFFMHYIQRRKYALIHSLALPLLWLGLLLFVYLNVLLWSVYHLIYFFIMIVLLKKEKILIAYLISVAPYVVGGAMFVWWLVTWAYMYW